MPKQERDGLLSQIYENLDDKYPHGTIRDYYNNTYKFTSEAEVIDIFDDGDMSTLVFDRTIFHP